MTLSHELRVGPTIFPYVYFEKGVKITQIEGFGNRRGEENTGMQNNDN